MRSHASQRFLQACIVFGATSHATSPLPLSQIASSLILSDPYYFSATPLQPEVSASHNTVINGIKYHLSHRIPSSAYSIKQKGRALSKILLYCVTPTNHLCSSGSSASSTRRVIRRSRRRKPQRLLHILLQRHCRQRIN